MGCLFKKLVLSVFLFGALLKANGQKKPLDYTSPDNWPMIRSFAISNDGKFVRYEIEVKNKGLSFFVQATGQPWKRELTGVVNSVFTVDSYRLIFMLRGDSLGVWDLQADSIHYILGVESYKVPEGGKGSYIAYQKKDSLHTLVVNNLEIGTETEYAGIGSYYFDPQGAFLLMVANASKDSVPKRDVVLLDLPTGRAKVICHSSSWADDFVFNKSGTDLAFLEKRQVNGQLELCLRYYKDGIDSAEVLVSSVRPGMVGMLVEENDLFFDKDGTELCFSIENSKNHEKPSSGAFLTDADVTIRGVRYLDVDYDQSKQPFLAAVDLNDQSRTVVRLQPAQDAGRIYYNDQHSGWILAEGDIVGDPHDSKWDVLARPNLYLVSAKDGSRRLLGKRLLYFTPSFSPLGKYVIWYDQVERQWMCHNIIEGETRNITSKINTPLYMENDYPDLPRSPEIAGWLEKDEAVLIYDRYDIWKVDPNGIKAPVNLTQRYGAENHIRLRLPVFRDFPPVISKKDSILLTAFDLVTKQDGFFQLNMCDGHLEKLCLTSHIYNFQGDDFGGAPSPGPTVKAKFAKTYLLTRMNATEYPNLYTTQDFKTFKSMTDLAPQKEYNWYTTELVRWKLPDGKPAEGLLFKPENFDPKLRYPIIFYYYEKMAYDLNIFIHPALSKGAMNVPWFVSNGYLVFVPDIYYQIGHPGRSAYNSVTSAALYLSKKPWVNSQKMGLQGHSYGGLETNYIVTHSSLFAAAAPASAASNEVSAYGEIGIIWYYERRQGRMGATLWDRPDLYIENSAVFRANKVTTPLLIMQTKQDWIVPFAQGFQWYNALHRLGKKAWFLSYDGEDHILHGKNSLDYSIRLGQFFDHYLKGALAPKWMTTGVLPGMRGKDEGLELDMSGKQP